VKAPQSLRLQAGIAAMAAGLRRIIRSHYFYILGSALAAATLLLMWFGYRATAEWQRSTRLLVEQRTAEILTLMIEAVRRDMRGVQSQVLPQLELVDLESPRRYELVDDIAKAFARFPYPESFFAWTPQEDGEGALYVFNRADRPPRWRKDAFQAVNFPIVVLRDPAELNGLVQLLQEYSRLRTRFLLFETDIAGATYQVVARPLYREPSRLTLHGFVGFTVNLDWVRTDYLSELTEQLSQIVEGQSSVALEVMDETGAVITTTRQSGSLVATPALAREERFPLLFFDPVLRASMPPEALRVREWTARVEAIENRSVLAAATGARRTFAVISLAAVVAGLALILTVRAVRAETLLATMKSEFVSTVTHELKTPLSSIRLIGETLARGRFQSPQAVVEYSGLLLNEVSRLTHTVDNLLTVARIQDVARFYAFEPVDPAMLVESALQHFQPQLKELGFEVAVDIPSRLPTVYADRTALAQVLENLIDNAIRYSGEIRKLAISASASNGALSLKIADKGPGIAKDELPRVFEKFFRGRDASSGGSGLGLAIVHRIVRDHHGDIRLHSDPGAGTVAEVILPLADRTNS
jgi:two-component system phosphate regulon sensor histidine kinase PhoR